MLSKAGEDRCFEAGAGVAAGDSRFENRGVVPIILGVGGEPCDE